ncbi:MAG: cysteine synthase A [Methylococcales bacterium]|jgi:cysteine synthase|nr:cysteine synthase A [Methylococcales bacterium]MBT7444810.1 cysteine synthase A [Methylococcales bacterium]
MSNIFESNAHTVGKTPLVRLKHFGQGNILGKIEGRNPAYSVKCRIGVNMIEDAEARGVLTSGKEIIEATSGNTGIALAFVAASKGYPITLTMPSSMSLERRKILKSLGANLVLTEPAKGMKGAVAKAEELMQENPEKYVVMRQFDNPANPAIHEKTTGPEIWNDTDGDIDILVAGVGTGGTISGVSRYIKNTQGKKIMSVAVEPTASPIITQAMNNEALVPSPHKIQGIGAGFIPTNLDMSIVDATECVTNEEAMEFAHQLAQKEGILGGISCGAALAAATRLSNKPENKDKTIVVILPDSSERYLSSPLFEGMFSDLETVQ